MNAAKDSLISIGISAPSQLHNSTNPTCLSGLNPIKKPDHHIYIWLSVQLQGQNRGTASNVGLTIRDSWFSSPPITPSISSSIESLIWSQRRFPSMPNSMACWDNYYNLKKQGTLI